MSQRQQLERIMEIDRRIRERLWHPSQRIEEREDCTNAEVLEPKTLRAEIRDEVEKLRKVYSKGGE